VNLRNVLQRVGPFDWLVGIILSWLIPLSLVWNFKSSYFSSLVLWLIPIVLILPRFFLVSEPPPRRRRRAVGLTALYVLVLGSVLDLGLGKWVLDFDCRRPDPYVGRLLGIPYEEFFFYYLGGLAIALIYFWADEYWLFEYNVRRRRPLIPQPGKILAISWPVALMGITLIVGGIVAKQLVGATGGWIPVYYTFLVAVAFVPAMILYRAVKDLVNWQALSLTCVYVLLTSLLWEVTLGIPGYWWRYQPAGMIGKSILAWSYGTAVDCNGMVHAAVFPIEALLVWVAVTFSIVLFYEAAKAYLYDERPSGRRLLGPAPWDE
jgi:hypothetical protein